MKFNWQYSKLAYAITLVAVGFTATQAYSLPKLNLRNITYNKSSQVKFVPPPPPPDLDIPGDRVGAGRRGCAYAQTGKMLDQNKLLTALVPVTQQARGTRIVWGLTASERPTFLFYVPYVVNEARFAKFVLRTADNKLVYQTPVNLPQTASIVRLPLPATAPSLEIGKQYHWYFNVYCAEKKPPISVVHGWVQRRALTPDMQKQLATATPNQQVAIYFNNGIWYDAVTTLSNLRATEPRSSAIAQQWQSVLRLIGLEAIATEPIIRESIPASIRS